MWGKKKFEVKEERKEVAKKKKLKKEKRRLKKSRDWKSHQLCKFYSIQKKLSHI
jgi:hypothetical protein